MVSELEKNVIAAIQGDIDAVERPYAAIARSLDISEETLLDTLRDLCDRGVIRRFGATIRHQKSGYSANAMIAWQVAEDRVDAVGETLASFKQVSHCYRRNPAGDWPYNLYTMVHARDEDTCIATARQMAAAAGVERYALLFSVRELKKTSMQYFSNEFDDEDDD